MAVTPEQREHHVDRVAIDEEVARVGEQLGPIVQEQAGPRIVPPPELAIGSGFDQLTGPLGEGRIGCRVERFQSSEAGPPAVGKRVIVERAKGRIFVATSRTAPASGDEAVPEGETSGPQDAGGQRGT
jgi:hypothetical protein